MVFLDNIIGRQSYPLPEIERMHKANRKIGLGVMGWADMLIRLGISYASEAAVTLAEKVMLFITEEAIGTSVDLAKEHGPFPNWEGSAWANDVAVRNATLTTIAPYGEHFDYRRGKQRHRARLRLRDGAETGGPVFYGVPPSL